MRGEAGCRCAHTFDWNFNVWFRKFNTKFLGWLVNVLMSNHFSSGKVFLNHPTHFLPRQNRLIGYWTIKNWLKLSRRWRTLTSFPEESASSAYMWLLSIREMCKFLSSNWGSSLPALRILTKTWWLTCKSCWHAYWCHWIVNVFIVWISCLDYLTISLLHT